MFRYLSFFVIVCLVSFSASNLGGCASIVPPTGGPRDSLPPVLLNVTPGDSTLDFQAKKIVFSFNEYVQLDNPQQSILFSPVPKSNPTVNLKLRTVTVEVRDTLQPNTTYSIDFGNAIRDLNEGNPLRDFRYVFATGRTIDSLTISGRVIMAETGRSDSTLIVMLHTNFDDSAVIKERPRYIARLDSLGRFMFRSLPSDTFAIFAMKDQGGGRYLTKTQAFAFADSTIQSVEQPDDIVLYAYEEQEDTTSKGRSVPAVNTRSRPSRDTSFRYETNLLNGQLDLLDTLTILFPGGPVRAIDSTRIMLRGEKFDTLSAFSLVTDTSMRSVRILHPWTENTAYNILLEPGFATDSSNRTIRSQDTVSFRTRRKAEYGVVRLRFLNLDRSTNPVLLFVQNDQVMYTHVFGNSNQFNSDLFEPGEYNLRILLDANRNGRWDAGRYLPDRRQPERVVPVTRKLNVKANWDTEVDITL
jgi:hypothetical protein